MARVIRCLCGAEHDRVPESCVCERPLQLTHEYEVVDVPDLPDATASGATPNPGASDESAGSLCPVCSRPALELGRCAVCGFGEAAGVTLRWPWGSEELVAGPSVPVARDDASPWDDRLEGAYPNVSRRHAELRVGDGGLEVRDLGSRNGTWVSPTPDAPFHSVDGWESVPPGARVRFGRWDRPGVLELEVDGDRAVAT